MRIQPKKNAALNCCGMIFLWLIMRQKLPNNMFFEVIFPNRPIPKLYQKLSHFSKSSLRLKRVIGQFLPYNATFDLAQKESPISSLLV
jgi:hypothetical protein